MTLVELLVSMGVGSVLLIAIGVVFLSTIRGVTTINVKTSTTADGRIVLEATSRALRVTYKPASQEAAIISANTNEVTFYALLNRTGSSVSTMPDPSRVRLFFENGCIRQTLTSPTTDDDGVLSWNSSDAVTTCLARTSTAPVFRYFTSGADVLTSFMTVPPAGLSLNDRKKVRSIAVNISVQDPKNSQVTAVPMQDRVTLTNLVADDNAVEATASS